MLREKYNDFNDSEKRTFKQKLKDKVGITVKTFLERDCKKAIGKIETERLLTYIEILYITQQEIEKAIPKIAILIPTQIPIENTNKRKRTKKQLTKQHE